MISSVDNKKEPVSKSGIDRLPPNSTEAEQAVLGCILLSPADCLDECITKLKSGEKVFYDLRHQNLYRMMVKMRERNTPIDLITVQQVFKNRDQLDQIGGLGYLSGLPDGVPSAANLQYYLDIVLEKYLQRKMIQTCTQIIGQIYDSDEIDAMLDDAERSILQIGQERNSGAVVTTKEFVNRAISKIEQCYENKGTTTGISTGFTDFDKMTTGMHEGEMIVIAARPSMGKTALAMNIAEHAAIDNKIPVGVFSLEMTGESLMMRMICSRSGIDIRSVRDGFLAERDFPKLTGAAGKLANAPLYIDDTGGLSILQLRAKARTMWQQHGIKLFVIDYLQLLHSNNRRNDNRQQEIAEISGGVKALAKELKVPIIVLSQLNRELEKRGPGERPRMSDLRESGAIEQDADLVGLLYKEVKKNEDEDAHEDYDTIPVKLYVAKQRNGPTGDVDLIFRRQFTRFETASKIAQEDADNYRSPHAPD